MPALAASQLEVARQVAFAQHHVRGAEAGEAGQHLGLAGPAGIAGQRGLGVQVAAQEVEEGREKLGLAAVFHRGQLGIGRQGDAVDVAQDLAELGIPAAQQAVEGCPGAQQRVAQHGEAAVADMLALPLPQAVLVEIGRDLAHGPQPAHHAVRRPALDRHEDQPLARLGPQERGHGRALPRLEIRDLAQHERVEARQFRLHLVEVLDLLGKLARVLRHLVVGRLDPLEVGAAEPMQQPGHHLGVAQILVAQPEAGLAGDLQAVQHLRAGTPRSRPSPGGIPRRRSGRRRGSASRSRSASTGWWRAPARSRHSCPRDCGSARSWRRPGPP
ncbi:MAG: hypothetical protein Q4615_11215 [Paracoccus aminovorans]|nr:hypothetical protein [Paracoccus aminovorans]